LQSVPSGAAHVVPLVGLVAGQLGSPQIHWPLVQVQFGPG
jgi:hypothetical protein